MRTLTTIIATAAFSLFAQGALAQTNGDDGGSEGSVIIPSQMKLSEEQKTELEQKINAHLVKALKRCVAQYPRPEFFTLVAVEYELRKSGDLRGGYIVGTTADPNVYVKDEEERAAKEKEGTFTHMVVREDRNLERCMKRATKGFDTGFDRYSARILAEFNVTWEGKKPSLEAAKFEVSK